MEPEMRMRLEEPERLCNGSELYPRALGAVCSTRVTESLQPHCGEWCGGLQGGRLGAVRRLSASPWEEAAGMKRDESSAWCESRRFGDSLGEERVWERDDAHASGLGK